MRSEKTLYATRDGRIVEEGDTAAAVQLVRAGSEIRDADIKGLGGEDLVKAVYAHIGGSKAVPQAENKAIGQAPATKALEDHTIEELKALAEERGVEVPNGPKADIVAALEEAAKALQE